MNNILQFSQKSNSFIANLDDRLLKSSPKLYTSLDFIQKLFFWILKRVLIIALFVSLFSLGYIFLAYSICFVSGAAVSLITYLKQKSKSEFYAEKHLVKLSYQNNRLKSENETIRELLLSSYQSYVDIYTTVESDRKLLEKANEQLQDEKNVLERELVVYKKIKDHYKDILLDLPAASNIFQLPVRKSNVN